MPFFIAKDKIINIHYNNSHKNTSYIIVNNTIIFRKCRNYTGFLLIIFKYSQIMSTACSVERAVLLMHKS